MIGEEAPGMEWAFQALCFSWGPTEPGPSHPGVSTPRGRAFLWSVSQGLPTTSLFAAENQQISPPTYSHQPGPRQSRGQGHTTQSRLAWPVCSPPFTLTLDSGCRKASFLHNIGLPERPTSPWLIPPSTIIDLNTHSSLDQPSSKPAF